MGVCFRVLKEINKSMFHSESIDHIPYYVSGLSHTQFFRQPFSKYLYFKKIYSLEFLVISPLLLSFAFFRETRH